MNIPSKEEIAVFQNPFYFFKKITQVENK